MKACVVLLVLSLAAVSYQQNSDHKQQFHANKDACIKETNAKEDDVRKALKEAVYADNKNLKCFFKCMGQKTGIISAAGALDVDALKKHIPHFLDQAKAVAAIDKCKAVKATDPCEIAFEYEKCFRQEIGPMQRPPKPGN